MLLTLRANLRSNFFIPNNLKSIDRSHSWCHRTGPVTGFVQYAPMLLLLTVSPQDVRGQNIAIKVYFRKSLGEHTDVSHRDAPRLITVSKHHFRQNYSGNVFKGLASQATELGLNCSYP